VANTTLSTGVAGFSLRSQPRTGAAFLAQAEACYSSFWLNDKVIPIGDLYRKNLVDVDDRNKDADFIGICRIAELPEILGEIKNVYRQE
jgi:hypothetical protein